MPDWRCRSCASRPISGIVSERPPVAGARTRRSRVLRIVSQCIKIGSIALIAVLVLFGSVRAFAYYRDEAARDAKNGQPVLVTIHTKDSSDAVAGKLSDAGLINSKLYFRVLLRFS